MQHTFFVHFFAVVLHDYNVKLPETSLLHVLWRKCHTCSCSLPLHFTLPLIFTLMAASISHFSHSCWKIFMLFVQQTMCPLYYQHFGFCFFENSLNRPGGEMTGYKGFWLVSSRCLVGKRLLTRFGCLRWICVCILVKDSFLQELRWGHLKAGNAVVNLQYSWRTKQ